MSSRELIPHLEAALDATDYPTREAALAAAYETVAELHNRSGLTDAVDPSTRPYHGRPFTVIHADRFVDACLDRLEDEWLRSLPLIGSIDQCVDSTDVLSNPLVGQRLRDLYASVRAG
jgi:hypothetical protein